MQLNEKVLRVMFAATYGAVPQKWHIKELAPIIERHDCNINMILAEMLNLDVHANRYVNDRRDAAIMAKFGAFETGVFEPKTGETE